MPHFRQLLKDQLTNVLEDGFSYGRESERGEAVGVLIINYKKRLEAMSALFGGLENYDKKLETITTFFMDMIDVEFLRCDTDGYFREMDRHRKLSEGEIEAIDDALAVSTVDGDLVECRNEIIKVLGLRAKL